MLCAARSADCGSLSVADSCGQARQCTCGRCTGTEQCEQLRCREPRHCTPGGWCFVHPLPQGNTLQALAADSSGTWLVGRQGTIVQLRDNQLVRRSCGTDHYRAIVPAPAGGFFVGGGAGSVQWVQESGCTALPLPTSGSILGLWRPPTSTGAWAVTSTGEVLRFLSGTWTKHSQFPGVALASISGSSEDDVWVVGIRMSPSLAPVAYRLSAGTFVETPIPTGLTSLHSVWASSPDDAWAGGQQLVHWDGASWKVVSAPIDLGREVVVSISGSSPSRVFAGFESGKVLRYDGKSWSEMAGSTERPVYSVQAILAAPERTLLCGEGGVIEQVSDSRLVPLFPRAIRPRAPLWGVASDHQPHERTFVVGSQVLASWKDDELQLEAPPVSDLFALWADPSSGEVLAVGTTGTMLHYAADRWTQRTTGVSATLFAVWGSCARDAWVAGASGTLAHWDGERLGPKAWSGTTTLHSLSGTAPSNVWAVGARGLALRFDGRAWTEVPTGEQADLNAALALGPADVWVGGRGALRHFDGRTWTPAALAMAGVEVVGLCAGGGSVWAVGTAGFVAELRESQWTRHDVGSDATVSSCHVDSTNSVWLVAEQGIVLRREAQ